MKLGSNQSMGLDKFSIGLSSKLSHGCTEADLRKLIPHIRNVATRYFNTKVISSKRCKSHRRHVVYSDDGKFKLITVHSGYAGHTPFINFEFNPSKMTGLYNGERDAFYAMGLYDHYDTLYQYGVVSHVEFYVDIEGVASNELALIDLSKRTGKVFKGTQYLGGRTSAQSVVKYDRLALLKAKSLPVPKSSLGVNVASVTRIEVRLADRAVGFRQLVEQDTPSPFDTFIVVPRSALGEVAQHWNHPALSTRLMQPGLFGATKGNAAARESIRHFLQARQIAWWEKEQIWATHVGQMQFLQGKKGWSSEPMFLH